MYLFIILTLITGYCTCLENATSELLSVVVIYRHGDRTIVKPYPTDPYKNASYWPVGFGQLTNKGKEQQLQLGRWFRSRYSTFLPISYSEKDITIRSTDVDRTLMSAEANLAGLYPPSGKSIWDQTIQWQPIPIHTKPEKEDALLAMKKPCPKYTELHNKLMKSPFFTNINHQNHDLYAYLTRNSGDPITTIATLEYLYNTLLIETFFNFTLPTWALKVFPAKLEPSAFLSFATQTFTPELARLKTGPLLNEIVQHFNNATTKQPDSHKFLMFSGHDTTVANILNSIGAFEYHGPPYTSTVIFELRKLSGKNFVNVYYKNSSEALAIRVKGCDWNCDFEQFVTLLKPISLSLKQWEDECKLSWIYYWPLSLAGNILLFSLCGMVLLLASGILISLKCTKKPKDNSYIQLPNEEYA